MATQSNERMVNYWKTKGFKESARLHLQHWLFQSTLGYVIHPSIAGAITAKNDLRVADIACGNGAWLIEVSEKLPEAQLYGFDIQPIHFPSSIVLPANIKLAQQDVLQGSWSGDLAGSFDFVHIRAFSSLIKNNDLTLILGTVNKLLKPGGYLQWDETDPGSMTARAGDGQSAQMCKTLLNIIAQGGQQGGIVFDWLRDIETHFKQAAFDDIQADVGSLKPHHLKAWTEDYLLVYEEVSYLLPSEQDTPETPLSREKYLGLFGQVVKETEAGAVMYPERTVVTTARKT